MAFDGIVTKAIASELQQLSGARIDKIYQPNKNTIILGFYYCGKNYALNLNIDPINYRCHLTTHSQINPKVAPNFCMVLRKHLIGLHIKNLVTNNLERIITIEFEGFDDVDDIITKKLIIELMGKHCNLILLDEQNLIIDSIRHINSENSTRNISPHTKYTYPPVSKLNILECKNFEAFIKPLEIEKLETISTNISNTYNGISKTFIDKVIENLKIVELNTDNLKKIYSYITNLINLTTSNKLKFETIYKNNTPIDYTLVTSASTDNFELNYFIDDYYFLKESKETFKNYRNNILKMILNTLKKYKKRLYNINEKLENCENMDLYKLYGELITANLYKIKNQNISNISLENYYDNNNLISIPLDIKYTPSVNAKRYFKKYNKLKNALEIVTIQKKETEKELNYIESIVYELENSSNIDEVLSIFEEITENVIFQDKVSFKKNPKVKKSNLTKNKKVSFNPIKYTIDGFTLFVGRNNKENDYLTLKFSKKTDLWFHTKDIHGSHAILIINGKVPSDEVLIKSAQIVAFHSKARDSSNVPVDYCEVKFVKKPKGSKPGMVIYTNNKTLTVQPKL